jgi:hypothetical protein
MVEGGEILVADECWVALALLHREHPERTSFTPRQILDRLKQERAHAGLRPGVQTHIYLHNVANIPPNSAKYRMFYRLEDATLRLYRPGDDFDAARTGKAVPQRSELPQRYHELLDWYENEYCRLGSPEDEKCDPILQMLGVGREIWREEGGDAFVTRERASWEREGKPPHDPPIRGNNS